MKIIWKLSCLSLALGLAVTSCKKEEITPPNESNPPNAPIGITTPIGSGTNITTSIGGVITDENDQPVENALITIGTKTATTNQLGIFVISNVIVDADRAYVKVEKSGYFLGSRALNPKEGTIHNVKIKLLSKSLIDSFSNNSGATIQVSGVSLLFEAGDVSLENGSPYVGYVNVYAAYLNPMASDISEIMPGDLSARDANNNVVFLESYGMVVVELEGSNGETLNVAPGATVDLSMNVQIAQAANAPGTIPLWYFNEAHGNWVEEGSATLTGNMYVGEVSHFSYWNCDDPYGTIEWSITLECNGSPLSNVPVRISNSNTGAAYGTSYTNSLGQIVDPIPQGLPLLLEIFGTCGNVIYSQNLGVVTTPLDLGVISVCNGASTSTFSATAVDCNNQPIPYAIFNITALGTDLNLIADANGNVSTSFTHCSQANIDVAVYDLSNQLQSQTASHPLSASLTLGNVMVCDQLTGEFIEYTADGQQYIFNGTSEVYSLPFAMAPQFAVGGQTTNDQIILTFEATGTGTYPNIDIIPVNVVTYWQTSTSYNYIPSNAIDINITQFAPNIGDYFEGTFGGQYPDSIGVQHTINGSFRIQRDY